MLTHKPEDQVSTKNQPVTSPESDSTADGGNTHRQDHCTLTKPANMSEFNKRSLLQHVAPGVYSSPRGSLLCVEKGLGDCD